MGYIHIFERGSAEYTEFMDAVSMAKEAIDTICDLTSEMEEQYGERGVGTRMRSEMPYKGMDSSESRRISMRRIRR